MLHPVKNIHKDVKILTYVYSAKPKLFPFLSHNSAEQICMHIKCIQLQKKELPHQAKYDMDTQNILALIIPINCFSKL